MRLRTVSLLGLFAFQAVAAPPAPPQDLPATIQRQVATREALKTQAEDGQAALHKWYESQLDALKVDAASKANLDAVLATDAERGRMDRDLTPEETAALPKTVRDVRARFDQARLQRATQQKAALTASLREYMIALDALEKSLTRKLDVEGAVAARKERAAAGDEVSALAVPGAVVNVTPALSARSGPYVRPTSPEPAKVKVASELKAYGTIQSPAPKVIAFEMPPPPPNSGVPANGGRGVVLKNDPADGRNGTTWSINWSYSQISPFGITFVHPFGNGHVMLRLRSSRFEPMTRSGWETYPFIAGGSPTFLKTPEGVTDPFPLQPNRKYAIATHLDATGHFTLSVDGQVVRTGEYGSPDHPQASYTSAAPIALPEGFTGEGLPMQWEAGYAGLLVWPTVSGALNLCEDITFQADRAAMAQAAPAPVAPPAVAPPAVAVTPPLAVTPPRGAPPAIAPATPVRATPAPLHATSLAASGGALLVQVASELKFGGTIQNPAKDAVPFETPMGSLHAKGGRGVLLKNDSAPRLKGSTWSVEWTTSPGNALLFVHPHNNGHIIVRLGQHGPMPVYLSGFQSNPMSSGGPSTIFKEAAAGADVYPLKSNQKYSVVSQFDSKGRYTLTIDGKVVNAGSFANYEVATYISTSALTLPEGFKGENLPMKWKAGYAAMMMVPVFDSSASVCENIAYQASAPTAEKVR